MHSLLKTCAPALLILLGACANKEPVKAFATTTADFTKSFDTYANQLKSTCQRKYIYQSIAEQGPYNVEGNAGNEENNCDSFKNSDKELKIYSKTVNEYAASLGKLAGIEGNVLDDDIDTFSKKVSEFDKENKGKIPDNVLSAIAKLIKTASNITVDFMVERKIKEELNANHESLKVVVTQMQTVVNRVYGAQLSDVSGYADELVKGLVPLSFAPEYNNATSQEKDTYAMLLADNTDPKGSASVKLSRIPYRLAQAQLYKEKVAIYKESDAIKSFNEACQALISAHAELKNNFGKLTKEEMLSKIKDFYDKAKEARENFNTIRA